MASPSASSSAASSATPSPTRPRSAASRARCASGSAASTSTRRPGRWLVWHGHGPFGRNRYACADHRGDLTASIRETYGTLGSQPWKRPPYPTTRRTEYTERAIRAARGQSSFGRS